MQWDAYKELCDQPDYWSRWMLEQCADLMAQQQKADLQALLEAALEQPPLPMPLDHRGPPATQMYQLQFTRTQRQAMLLAVAEAQQKGLTTSQTKRRGLGGFVQAWQEYVSYES